MPTLQAWLDAATDLEAVYQAELGRSVFSDPQAFVNWAWHRLDQGTSLDGIIGHIRQSDEWRARHGVVPVPSPPVPSGPAPPLHPGPPVPGGVGRVLRVTDESDGPLLNRTYSYWANAWVRGGHAYVFVGHADESPRFFLVDLQTGAVQRLGSLVPYRGTAEGWYWDASGEIYLLDGPRLRRVGPLTGTDVVVFDISESHPGCILWQAHSSEDGQTHSATVKRVIQDGAYPAIGTVVFRQGRQEYYPSPGVLDESQITADGGWLVIKEDERNRIINLHTRQTDWIEDTDGAVGHSDCGHGFLVGEDNIHGACVLWDLRQPLTPERRRELFHTWGMGVVSVRGQRCIVTDHTWISAVDLQGGGVTPIVAHGMTGSGYDFTARASFAANSDRLASYLSNAAGRFDLYLLVV